MAYVWNRLGQSVLVGVDPLETIHAELAKNENIEPSLQQLDLPSRQLGERINKLRLKWSVIFRLLLLGLLLCWFLGGRLLCSCWLLGGWLVVLLLVVLLV